MTIAIHQLVLCPVPLEGWKLAGAVTVPVLAQDIISRHTYHLLRQIPNGNLRTCADLALRFSATLITAGLMAPALGLPVMTVLIINAVFIATIGTYTVFFGNSFTIEIDDWLQKYSELTTAIKENNLEGYQITSE